MKVYVFGNQDLPEDNKAIIVSNDLKKTEKDISFVFVKPNEDVPFIDESNVVIIDTVAGINDVEVIKDEDLNKLHLSPRSSVHDFDLAFQLKYLKKINKIGKVAIVAIPQDGDIDYLRIQSILRKLVAQDMHGS
jgi:Ni,Fe-hydrogenase maturation factor